MKYLAIIPARYASTRFPGKPLAMLGDTEVINHVWRRVERAGVPAVVATDDERILRYVTGAGGRAVMTRPDHCCGTDRLVEAVTALDTDADVIINVQGDEPFIHPEQILALRGIFENAPETMIATLARPYPGDAPADALLDPNLVKVVTDGAGHALYFSRSPIPFMRGVPEQEWPRRHRYLTHIGVYAYRREILLSLPSLPPSPLEQAESLEQLRWLQAGLGIAVAESTHLTVGIDTPADLERARDFLNNNCLNDIAL